MNSFNHTENHAPIHLTHVSDAIITNTNFTGLTSGSIISDCANLYIGSCIFCNVSSSSGGALHLSNTTSIIAYCLFQNCSAKSYGGSIYNRDGKLKVDSCSFANNIASEGYSMYSTGGNCFIEKCIFSGEFKTEISGSLIQKFNNTFVSALNVVPLSFVTPSATFTPSPSMSPVPFTYGPDDDGGWTRNTKIIVGCGCGIGGCILIIVVAYIIYVKVKQINSSKVYVAESTNENKQPTGTTFVSKTYDLP
ncbi:adhesin-like protein [Histomonas meleagridis]|uniref:adhesin-like protein n=1 Tax=Histomonas meleagridis TaxID=135588 RepID=UPI00355AC67F|nr:adhesin-like protein [Histomonas meleagridis]KAH0803565.1 adhesin-like protein [Histomonas meleagridis]